MGDLKLCAATARGWVWAAKVAVKNFNACQFQEALSPCFAPVCAGDNVDSEDCMLYVAQYCAEHATQQK